MKVIKRMCTAAAVCAMLLGAGVASAEVTIGFTGIFSGPVALLGTAQYNGFMLEVDELGGKLGGQKVKVIKMDDQLKPAIGLQNVKELINRDHIDALVGGGFSNVAMAIVGTLEKKGIPTLLTNSGASPIAGKLCGANVFEMAWQNDGPAEATGMYAQTHGYKDVYLMAPNYQAGKDMLAGFQRYYKGKIAGKVLTPLGQTDYSPQITQLQLASPDALYVFYPGGMGVSFVKQLSLAGMIDRIPFLSVFTVDNTTVPAVKGAAAGAIGGTMWSPALKNAANQHFIKAYTAKYGRAPSDYAAVGYDAARLLNLAIQKVGAKASDHAALVNAIKTSVTKLKSVRGPFAFNVNNMPIQNYYMVKFVKKGDSVVQKVIETPLKMHKDAYYKSCPMYHPKAS